MNVVAHQRAHMNGAAAIASRFFQSMEIAVVVLFGKKKGIAIDAALNNVQWESG